MGLADTTSGIKVLREGAKKANPFTIAIVANPALETPWKSGTFVVDSVMTAPADFYTCA